MRGQVAHCIATPRGNCTRRTHGFGISRTIPTALGVSTPYASHLQRQNHMGVAAANEFSEHYRTDCSSATSSALAIDNRTISLSDTRSRANAGLSRVIDGFTARGGDWMGSKASNA